ncbi:protein C-mannosyl-transferase DPY19L1 isoform X2 [Rhodnius prolixus]
MAVRKRDKHNLGHLEIKENSRNKQRKDCNKNSDQDDSRKVIKGTRKQLLLLCLAFIFAALHRYHVSTLFENDRHFSHLSTLEREMTFRSEMGMYYSYYKRIVEASTFINGFQDIIHDNLTEFPSQINTLERFNLFPEVFLGGAYRIFNWLCDKFGYLGKQCWEIERGHGLSPVLSCEGIRQPEYFYVEAVWLCAGLTASVIFLYGYMLSDSLFGGLISVLSFFYNHGECTRVQWTPPLRESFAYPFCLLQMYCVTWCIQTNSLTNITALKCARTNIQIGSIAVLTSLCLTMWQFSQFLFATQIIAILIMFMFGFINRTSTLIILIGQMLAVIQTLFFMFGNELLLSSVLTCLLIASLISILFLYPVISAKPDSFARTSVSTFAAVIVAIILKTRALTTNDDAHIVNILRSKFSSFRDFHTLLYTCSEEFDFIGWQSIVELTRTCLLPLVIILLILLFLRWLISPIKYRAVEPHIVYNVLQLGAFTIMATLIMRLKLFFTPHLCIIAAIVASRKYFHMIPGKFHYPLLIVLMGCMHISGVMNILAEHRILGEFSDVGLEELLEWISEKTPKDAVFAGPMSVTAAILLSSKRPIVNHPHYEDARLRERTKKVYSVYSRKPPEEVFKTLSSLGIDYLVLLQGWCYSSNNRIGCRMIDLWDVEDGENRNRPPTCPQLLMGQFPFHLAFTNPEYAVLKLQPPYIELKGFNKY